MEVIKLVYYPNSAKEAKLKGYKKYFTGKPCIRGHYSLRLTSTHQCLECLKIQATDKHRSDLKTKLSSNLRSRLRAALRNKAKSGSSIRDLGCSIEDFIIYIGSKFQNGMSWENYGMYGWHIDHIMPVSSFDLTDRNQHLKACHYSNLQPLWAKDNLSKSNKIL